MPSGDSYCSLREAIANANGPGVDTTGGDCAVGTGNDIISFSVSGTMTLGSALPAIANTSPGSLTIDGSGQTITVDGAGTYQVLVVNSGAALNLSHLTIAHGHSAEFVNGGGISNNGALSVSNSTFSGNSAGPANTWGGGIFSSGTLAVSNSTFSGNSAGGGGSIASPGTLTVTNSTFSANSATFGGGIWHGPLSLNSPGGTATISNSTLVGNLAAQGGGIFENGITLTLTNDTFSGNSSQGAIFNWNSTITGTNSILANGSSGGNCYQNQSRTTVPGGVTNGGGSISDDSSCSFGSPIGASGQTLGDNVNPLLDPNGLQNNGGSTQTIALQATSPAIDAIVRLCLREITCTKAGPLKPPETAPGAFLFLQPV
jgi:hypothetical protein